MKILIEQSKRIKNEWSWWIYLWCSVCAMWYEAGQERTYIVKLFEFYWNILMLQYDNTVHINTWLFPPTYIHKYINISIYIAHEFNVVGPHLKSSSLNCSIQFRSLWFASGWSGFVWVAFEANVTKAEYNIYIYAYMENNPGRIICSTKLWAIGLW